MKLKKESLVSRSFSKVQEWFCTFFNTEFHGLRYKFELRCQLDRLRHSLDSAKILFRLGVGGKIIPRIRLTSAKDLVEVEAELGNTVKRKNWLVFTYLLTL